MEREAKRLEIALVLGPANRDYWRAILSQKKSQSSDPYSGVFTQWDDVPLAHRLIFMSMTAEEKRAFKRYAVMRGGDPAKALARWIERHADPADPSKEEQK